MRDTKKCTKCGRELPLDQFGERKLVGGNKGYKSWCKDCLKFAARKWRKDNPEKTKTRKRSKPSPEKARAKAARWRKNHPEYGKEWKKNNPEKVKSNNIEWQKNNPGKRRASVAKWRKNNPGYCAKHDRMRRAIDPNFKLIKNIRRALLSAIRYNTKAGHTIELLGCSIEYLRQHLERQFKPGMSWDNYGLYGWHIDHIIPVSYFDHSDPEQQRRCWHYTNLRPLWAEDNLRKHNNIEEIQLKLQ